jgi:hypothetical protein
MKKILLLLLTATALWGYGDGAIYWTPHGCDDGKVPLPDTVDMEKGRVPCSL